MQENTTKQQQSATNNQPQPVPTVSQRQNSQIPNVAQSPLNATQPVSPVSAANLQSAQRDKPNVDSEESSLKKILKKFARQKGSSYSRIGIKKDKISLEQSNKKVYYLGMVFLILITIASFGVFYLRYNQNSIFLLD